MWTQTANFLVSGNDDGDDDDRVQHAFHTGFSGALPVVVLELLTRRLRGWKVTPTLPVGLFDNFSFHEMRDGDGVRAPRGINLRPEVYVKIGRSKR